MNTKQVLYNVLKSQLDVKEQEYQLFHNTVTTSAINELNNEIKQYLNTLTPINDTNIEIGLSRITIRAHGDGNWYRDVELTLESNYNSNNKYVDVNWNSGVFNLRDKIQNKVLINLISVCANNIKSIEDKWINNWYERRKQIDKVDYDKSKEYTDLKTALSNLRSEINDDIKESMKQIGFEIKKFKDIYDLDWSYIKDENDNATERVYRINITPKAIKLQIGRSYHNTTYVNGFKVLGKKGNKYKIEVYRENFSNTFNYEVLEKKFDSFINDVVEWENDKADKRKAETEKNYTDRTQ